MTRISRLTARVAAMLFRRRSVLRSRGYSFSSSSRLSTRSVGSSSNGMHGCVRAWGMLRARTASHDQRLPVRVGVPDVDGVCSFQRSHHLAQLAVEVSRPDVVHFRQRCGGAGGAGLRVQASQHRQHHLQGRPLSAAAGQVRVPGAAWHLVPAPIARRPRCVRTVPFRSRAAAAGPRRSSSAACLKAGSAGAAVNSAGATALCF